MRTAEELLQRLPDLIDDIQSRVIEGVPALGEPALEAPLRAGCEANLLTMLTTLKAGETLGAAHAPPGALALSREMVHLGADLRAVLRGYRLANRWFLELMIDGLGAQTESAATVGRALAIVSDGVFAYIDTVCEEITDEYEAERARWLPTAAAVRDAAIRGALAGEVAADAASRTLGYDLTRTHVGVIAWGTGDVEGALSVLLQEAGVVRPLVHAVTPDMAWAWAIRAAPLDLPAPPASLQVAVGNPQRGPEGFAASHREALEARRVSVLAGSSGATLVHFRDVEHTALMSRDVEAARVFVAHALGALSVDDAATRTLRRTALAVLDGASVAAAAHALGVHQNTVVKRVRRAEDLLGRSLSRERLRTHAALHLDAALTRPDG